MTRTIIRKISARVVSLQAENPQTGEVETREFWVPVGGGAVREGEKQVCDGLALRGATLQAGGPDDLLPLIRREWRRARAAEKRAAARW